MYVPPELIIFDCDGVLIDSEGVASALIADELTAMGWAMDAPEAMARFMGMSIASMQPMVEAALGRAVPEDWRADLAAKLVERLKTESRLIPGAATLLHRVNALGLNWRVASNSSDEEMDVKFSRTGLAALTRGRTHSAGRAGRPKPAPDVFLAAAASAGVAPARCVVLEDSALGVRGAVAAGMPCYGFAMQGTGAHLLAEGACAVFDDLHDFLGAII
jgi:HAD superfamily hydrolase (TIGR01509 family)